MVPRVKKKREISLDDISLTTVQYIISWERSGSVVECLTRDRRTAGSSLTGVTALWSLSKTHLSYLVLVQPRKTCPYITERLLMGCKESNQTKQTKYHLM